MPAALSDSLSKDHCRIGSLEMPAFGMVMAVNDHCRIGSLENLRDGGSRDDRDHCRIGSLENDLMSPTRFTSRSLPHRQLRNSIDSG